MHALKVFLVCVFEMSMVAYFFLFSFQGSSFLTPFEQFFLLVFRLRIEAFFTDTFKFGKGQCKLVYLSFSFSLSLSFPLSYELPAVGIMMLSMGERIFSQLDVVRAGDE